jgi:outer membrane protein OmpA-like peptidoglycan-associated protein
LFDSNKSDLQASDSGKASEIASYLTQNPGQQVGIDGSIDPTNKDLSDRRVSAVRTALLQAGVPSNKIQTGAFGKPELRRDRHVVVLVSKL